MPWSVEVNKEIKFPSVYNCIELSPRELHIYELSFLGSGLLEYWLRDQFRLLCCYLENTGQESLKIRRAFSVPKQNTGSSLVLKRTTKHPNRYTGDPFPLWVKQESLWLLQKTKQNKQNLPLLFKETLKCTKISKLEQCHQKLNFLMLGANPK